MILVQRSSILASTSARSLVFMKELPFIRGNTHDFTNCAKNKSGRNYGLFSIKNLYQPADFLRLASEAMAKCDSLRVVIANQVDIKISTKSQASEILFILDSISKHVCNVIDVAELCRCVHTDPSWRESATNAFSILSDYIAQLNVDTNLYRRLTNVVDSNIFENLSEEQQRFATLLKAEFERDGIHLADDDREKLRQIQNQIVQLETLFQENINNSKKLFDVDANLVEQIFSKDTLEANVPQSGIPGKLTLSTDGFISNTVGRYSGNPQLRKEVYMESMTSCPENLEVLESLRRIRYESANLQGFGSYAERCLRDKMANTPEAVDFFLRKLQERITYPYQKDMEIIQNAKRKVEGCGDVEPWDIPFYTGILKSRNGLDPTELSAYFTIQNCVEGMKILVRELFGIILYEEVMYDDERWDHGAAKEGRARKFLVTSEAGDDLGTMYLDLHPREGKYVHAAHFTILCGCAESVDAKNFQLPVVALVCNLSPEGNVLSHSEVETLYHEFGHALHSLLSRTTFQHMSGTRASMDFVETPSHLLEHYAWNPYFLRLIGKHHLTDEIIPDKMIELLLQSQQEFKSIELQNQILYSRFDQELFGPLNDKSSINIFASLYRQHQIPYAEGTHWHTRFGHLVTYGAGYYGYLYAQAFASDLWTELKLERFSRASGKRLWEDLLGHGGARDPQTMMYDLLGRKRPSVDALFKDLTMKTDNKEKN